MSLTAIIFLLAGSVALADQDGAINLIGEKGICIVDGDFSKIFESGDLIEVSRFNKPFATGYVEQVNTTYMIVKVETLNPDYFLETGDYVRKPLPKERIKMKTLRAQIKPKTEEEAASAGIEGTAEKQGELKTEDKPEVVETGDEAAKSATDVQNLLFERARKGGIGAGDEKVEKQGKLIISETKKDDAETQESKKVAPDSQPKETKAGSDRRKKALEKEQ
ncbi:MAG: hypothetical protein WCX65_15935 [bacterium]